MIEIKSGAPPFAEMRTIVDWLNDPELMLFSEQRHRKHTIDVQRDFIDSIVSKLNIYRRAYCNGVMIGTVSAYLDRHNSIADVGILIGSEYTGKGYGCHVWRTFCDQLAKDGIRKIEGGCMAQNKAMLRIFEKNGMRLEGTRRYHFQIGKDQYDDMALYGKLT